MQGKVEQGSRRGRGGEGARVLAADVVGVGSTLALPLSHRHQAAPLQVAERLAQVVPCTPQQSSVMDGQCQSVVFDGFEQTSLISCRHMKLQCANSNDLYYC